MSEQLAISRPALIDSGDVPAPNLSDLASGQQRAVLSLTRGGSALLMPVRSIVRMRPEKEMGWIDAGSVVATMADADTWRNRTEAFPVDVPHGPVKDPVVPEYRVAPSVGSMRNVDQTITLFDNDYWLLHLRKASGVSQNGQCGIPSYSTGIHFPVGVFTQWICIPQDVQGLPTSPAGISYRGPS